MSNLNTTLNEVAQNIGNATVGELMQAIGLFLILYGLIGLVLMCLLFWLVENAFKWY